MSLVQSVSITGNRDRTKELNSRHLKFVVRFGESNLVRVTFGRRVICLCLNKNYVEVARLMLAVLYIM